MMALLLVMTTALIGPYATPATPTDAPFADAYGYNYIDSDTTLPEKPVYNWIPIRDYPSAVRINGLADDNVVGPIKIGFSFPYYWYSVEDCYVGSNGYIAFGDNYLAAAPFTALPNSARPNNMIAALLSDLDFSGAGNPAKAWYWTNAAADTFIVEVDSAKFWNILNSYNTFQIILSRADSCIAVQYKLQQGAPTGGWAPGNDEVGIENITGTVGINYLNGNIPSAHMIHNDLAVKYVPPVTTTYIAHDVAPWNVMSENNGGIFVLRNATTPIWAKIKNAGNQIESSVPVYCQIRNAANTIVFADTIYTGVMNPGQIDSLAFLREWTPTTNGVYTMRVITNMTDDIFRRNDTIKVETRVVTLPAELGYDSGTPTASMYWNGNVGGFGIRFVPPAYPVEVTAIKANMTRQGSAVNCTLFLAEESPFGGPGLELGRGIVNVTDSTPKFYQVNFSAPYPRIDRGAFFVCVTSNGNQNPSYGMDSMPPISYQSWEYTGGWAPSRDAAKQDVMMHALVSLSTGMAELTPMSAVSDITLSAKPNPFGKITTIRFSRALTTPAVLSIYSVTGEMVRTMEVTGLDASWDGRNQTGRQVARGVYLARLDTGGDKLLKLVLTQ